MPIVDSSVFVRYLTREEGWEEAEKYLARPVTLALALKEVANALRTKTLSGDVNPDDAKLMIARVASMVRLVDQGDLLVDSYQVAIDHRITVYDALFIVAALRSGEDLVTCDDQQAGVARTLGVKVRTAD
jgi:predicted nucleic acid-binding protein